MQYFSPAFSRNSVVNVVWIFFLLFLCVAACSRRNEIPEGFYKVQPGWSRDQVVEMLGEPGKVALPPFKTSEIDECKRAASSQLVFKHDEHNSLLVFLDESEKVLCAYNNISFMEY